MVTKPVMLLYEEVKSMFPGNLKTFVQKKNVLSDKNQILLHVLGIYSLFGTLPLVQCAQNILNCS